MDWQQLTADEQADVREIVAQLRTAGIYESVSQVAQHYDDARAWATGRLTLAKLRTRTGWKPADPKDTAKTATAPTGEQPTHVEHNGERVLRLTWAQFAAREHNVGGYLVRFKLPGGYDYSEYLTEEYEFVSGDQTRTPHDDDLIYATIKVDTGRRLGRPTIGPKVETRLPDDTLKRVDAFAARTGRSQADALRVLITAGLDHTDDDPAALRKRADEIVYGPDVTEN